jgi:hypothetical protein
MRDPNGDRPYSNASTVDRSVGLGLDSWSYPNASVPVYTPNNNNNPCPVTENKFSVEDTYGSRDTYISVFIG